MQISQFKFDTTVCKLICLFAIDKMEVPVNEETIIDICSISNDWISQIECRSFIYELKESGFIYRVNSPNATDFYSMTQEGRICLAHFFARIPFSIREAISEYVKANRSNYRKKQEYVSDYFKNSDGTYTVSLKIIEPTASVLEIKLVVPSRQTAKTVHKQWQDKAASVYASLYENLID